jgi:dTDP-glucose pyrophosphorylase
VDKPVHVLVPLGGQSNFFGEEAYPFPKALIEVGGKPMIQAVVENLQEIRGLQKFIFVVRREDCARFHLDNTLRLLTDGRCEIVQLAAETRGAACSCLMAVDWIDHGEQLVVANGDQIIEQELDDAMQRLAAGGFDAGVISFQSVHPKWSYVRLGEDGDVVETAEKNPISKHAIAGFYYFRRGSDFVRAACKSIEKEVLVNDLYYIAPTLNELILENLKVGVYRLRDSDHYHSFYSPQKIRDYETRFQGRR